MSSQTGSLLLWEYVGLVSGGPFDVHRDYSKSGASPRVLDSMRVCQYRMTSYDEENSGPDFNLVGDYIKV